RLSSQDGFISYEKKLKTLLFLKMSKKRSAGGALTVSFISGGSHAPRGKQVPGAARNEQHLKSKQ
ncbi:hypothetical protein, partial [Metabacillus idriensis]|uniref:hypothetical protein n=1 Tax=Metabacillus idriensis TaxID=324768 RepID=UPI001CD2C035